MARRQCRSRHADPADWSLSSRDAWRANDSAARSFAGLQAIAEIGVTSP